jgi:hypothetical protein
MLKNNGSHQAFIEHLKDEKIADAYFYTTLEECKKMDKQAARKHMVEALQNLGAAHGSMGSGLLYKIGAMDAFYAMVARVVLKIVG